MTRQGKVAVIGAGFYGSTTAQRLAEYDVFDEVVLTDIIEGRPEGLALDLNQSRPIEGFETKVTGQTTTPDGQGYEVLGGSDIVIVTAGQPRKPGMSRMDLIETNTRIVRDVTENVVRHAPDAVLIVTFYAPSAAAARMARAVAEDAGTVLPVCAWVDGQYGISGVYLGVEAEIGRAGVRRVVERDLTEAELAGLRTAAEAVRAKQADVASL
jgi:malate/lactate dehydrogenase